MWNKEKNNLKILKKNWLSKCLTLTFLHICSIICRILISPNVHNVEKKILLNQDLCISHKDALVLCKWAINSGSNVAYCLFSACMLTKQFKLCLLKHFCSWLKVEESRTTFKETSKDSTKRESFLRYLSQKNGYTCN